MTRASDIEAKATEWLLRRTEPDWSADDQVELDLWIEAAVEHKMAYWRLEAGWAQVARMAALRSPIPRSAANDRKPWPLRWRIAVASVAAAMLAPATWWATHRPTLVETFQTAVGGRQEVPLADGTQIDLNTRTRLRTNLTGLDRQAWLDQGEAYFEVAHDSKRPFIVYAGPKVVTVLGTKFLVRRDGDHVEVAVVEGRVKVENVERPDHTSLTAAVLTPGDMIVGEGGSTMVAPKSITAVNDDLAWRDGLVNFDRVSLADAIAEFNRYNVKPLVVEGDVGDTRISGTFEARNSVVFAELLHRTYGLKVEQNDAVVKIIR